MTSSPDGRCQDHHGKTARRLKSDTASTELSMIPPEPIPVLAPSAIAMNHLPAPDPRMEVMEWDDTEGFHADPAECVRLIREGYVPVEAESLLNMTGETVVASAQQEMFGGPMGSRYGTEMRIEEGRMGPEAHLGNGEVVGLEGDVWIKGKQPSYDSTHVARGIDDIAFLSERYAAAAKNPDDEVEVLLVKGGKLTVPARDTSFSDPSTFDDEPYMTVQGFGAYGNPVDRRIDVDMIVDIRPARKVARQRKPGR